MIETIAQPGPLALARVQAEATAANGWLMIMSAEGRVFIGGGGTFSRSRAGGSRGLMSRGGNETQAQAFAHQFSLMVVREADMGMR
jgi:hypothetical protein